MMLITLILGVFAAMSFLSPRVYREVEELQLTRWTPGPSHEVSLDMSHVASSALKP